MNEMFEYDGSLDQILISSLANISKGQQSIESKFWHGRLDSMLFGIKSITPFENRNGQIIGKKDRISFDFNYENKIFSFIFNDQELDQRFSHQLRDWLVNLGFYNSDLVSSIKKVDLYDFAPLDLPKNSSSRAGMKRTGEGIAYALVDILHSNRKSFDELEHRLTQLVPNIARISLPRQDNLFGLELIDKYSEHHIPASDISDGTLRILAFLTALYQEKAPSIICFEELENGVHPWLLSKMMELLRIVSTEGITGNPVQILITTHSPLLLNYVEPHQVRAVELDKEGKTQVHKIPIDSPRFQKAMEAYDNALGELWFTNVIGGNPV
jgi:AAA15 family ATPase/GTPase